MNPYLPTRTHDTAAIAEYTSGILYARLAYYGEDPDARVKAAAKRARYAEHSRAYRARKKAEK